jgi:hypothetical protein
VYVFGQSHLLSVLPGCSKYFCVVFLFFKITKGNGSWLEAWSRKLRVSLLVFFGDFFLPLPRAIPLLIVFGRPIQCVLNEAPTQEEIDSKHSEFCSALSDVFDRHKESYGWQHKQLEIV